MDRALFITPQACDPPFNGATVYSSSLLRALRRRYKVDVVSLRDLRRGPEALRSGVVAAAGLLAETPLSVLHHTMLLRHTRIEARRYALIVADHAVSAHWARRHGLPYVLVAHNLEAQVAAARLPSRSLRRLYQLETRLARHDRAVQRDARGVICISATDAREIARHARLAAHIPPAFSETPIPATPKRDERLRLGLIGGANWAPNRLAVALLDRDVRAQLSRPGRWLLAGKGWNPAPEGWEALGPLASSDAFWPRIDILLAPGGTGGAGAQVKIMEALHHGVPVITGPKEAQAIFGDAPLPPQVMTARTASDMCRLLETEAPLPPRTPLDRFTDAAMDQRLAAFFEALAETDA